MIQQSNTLWNDHHCKSSNLQNYISITDYIPYAIYPCDVSILYLKVCISSSPSPSLPTPHPNHLFALCICKSVSVCLSDYTYKWDHMVLVFLWFTSFSIILSRSIHVVAGGIFHGWVVFHSSSIPSEWGQGSNHSLMDTSWIDFCCVTTGTPYPVLFLKLSFGLCLSPLFLNPEKLHN